MGFDLMIEARFRVNKEDGTFFVYGVQDGYIATHHRINPSEYVVPKEHREWTATRGHIFHAYIQEISDDEFEADARYFLEKFPTWEQVTDHYIYDAVESDWSEEKHNQFKAAIEWFASKPGFSVSWSY
jgi:hypothetical protein